MTTAIETGERILAAFKESLLQKPGSCSYIDNITGLPCAIGYLLPEEVRENLRNKGLNGKSIDIVCIEVPEVKDHLAGLTVNQAAAIQFTFDNYGAKDEGNFLFERIREICSSGKPCSPATSTA